MKIYRSLSFVLVAACLALSAPMALACHCPPDCVYSPEYRTCYCDMSALNSSLVDRDLQLKAEAGVTLDPTFAVNIFDVPSTNLCAIDLSTGFPEPFLNGLQQAGVSVVERDSGADSSETMLQKSASADADIAGVTENPVFPERD